MIKDVGLKYKDYIIRVSYKIVLENVVFNVMASDYTSAVNLWHSNTLNIAVYRLP